jgi:hypothetical protein
VFNGDNSKSQSVSRFYFAYHGSPFSIYTNWNGFQTNATEVNNSLKNFFMESFLAPSGMVNGQGISSSADAASGKTNSSGEDVQVTVQDNSVVVSGNGTFTEISLYDLMGRKMVDMTSGFSSVNRLPVGKPGVYMVKIQTSSELVVRKLMIR